VHILIVPSARLLPDDYPIAGIFQCHQAMALHNAGIKVGVIAPAPLYGWNLWKRIRRLSLDSIVDRRFPFPAVTYQGSVLWPGRLTRGAQLFWDFNAFNLFNYYVSLYGRPDLIHAHEVLFAGCSSMRLSDRFRIPYVITEHSSNFLNGSLRVTKRIKASYRKACARIMVSPFLGERVQSLIGHEATPWECVPNILPADFEHVTIQKKILKERFRFLCVAQFSSVKNHLCLLKAFASAFRGRDVELVLVGDGPLLVAAKDSANDLGIFSQLIFRGFQSRNQVLDEMKWCDVLVLPSLHETFGVVLIEAMSCGKPVIAASGSGPDAIVAEDNGLLFRSNDSIDLAMAMNSMFRNYARYDPRTIHDGCLSRYGEKAVVSKLINFYSRVLKDQLHPNRRH
jgi:glycosyltransferase involved in cell wall biosynthesis